MVKAKVCIACEKEFWTGNPNIFCSMACSKLAFTGEFLLQFKKRKRKNVIRECEADNRSGSDKTGKTKNSKNETRQASPKSGHGNKSKPKRKTQTSKTRKLSSNPIRNA